MIEKLAIQRDNFSDSRAISPLFLLLKSKSIVAIVQLVANSSNMPSHWMRLNKLKVSPSLQGHGALKELKSNLLRKESQ
ncbi:MAG: hypothetical protein QM632_05470 [Micrococcaceae bacterium]